ncbi:MAG: DUF6340 family protein [Bacteroidales bacterium]
MIKAHRTTYRVSFLLLLSCWIHSPLFAQDENLSFLRINVLRPAEEKIDPSIHSIYILPSSFILTGSFTGIDSDGNIPQYNPEPGQLAANTIHSFSKVLQNSPTLLLKIDSLGIQHGTGYSLTWEYIDSLCAQKKTDAVLCLEKIDIQCKAEISEQLQMFSYSDNTGSFSDEYYYVDRYSCGYICNTTTEWRLYFPGKHEVKGWNIHIADTCNSLSSGSTHRSAFSKKDLSMLTERATYYSGNRFACYISPSWKTVERAYFLGGNREMKKAARLLRKGNVKEAAILWKKVARTSHGKVAQYARYNLILVSEIRGQAEEAYRTAMDLWKISNLPEAYFYAGILKDCIKDEQLVKAQLRPQ